MKNFFFLVSFLLILFSSCSLLKNKKKSNDETIQNEKKQIAFKYNFVEASKQKMLGNISIAKDLYEKSIKLNPLSASSNYELSRIYFIEEKLDEAIFFSKKALELNSENLWYQLFLAELYRQNNELPNSIRILKKTIKSHPEHFNLYYDLAILLTNNGQTKEAIKIYNKIEKQIGVSSQVSINKERIFLYEGDLEAAIKELKKLIKKFPKESKYYGMLADLYLSQKDYKKARKIYDKLLEIDNNNGLVHLSLSEFYRAQNKDEKAIEELKIAFKNKDLDINLKLNIFASFLSVSDENKMEKEFLNLLEILLETHSENARINTVYAEFLIREKKEEEAIKYFKKALKLKKDEFMVWRELLFLENRLEKYKMLITDCEEAITYFPNQAVLYLLKGFAESRLNKNEASIKSFENGVSVLIDEDELSIQFYTYMGDVYNKLKEHKKSDIAYENVLKIDPENIYILNNYSYFLSLREDSLEKAEKMIKKCIEKNNKSASYLDTYAWILYKKGEFLQSLEIIKKAILHGGDKRAVILEHYGDILYKLNEKTKALEFWKKAMEKGKGSEFLEKKIKMKKL